MNAVAPASDSGRRFVDLHMHSTASDGVLPPEAVVAAAATASLVAIALTDHDSVSGIAAARAAAAGRGISVVAGVELSATEGERETHLLGLHIQRVAELDHLLSEFRAARLRRAASIVERLRSLGIPLELSAVVLEAAGGAVGRPHVARCMIAGGFVSDIKDAFDRYLGAGRPAYVPKERLSLFDAIELIHSVGGLSIFAHPGADGTVESISRMKSMGLDGVEVLHPSHSPADVVRLAALADHFGLLRSGGSDWHGVNGGRRVLGGQQVPVEWLDLQLQSVRARI